MYVYSLVMPKHACAPQPVAPMCVAPAIGPVPINGFPRFRIWPDGRVWDVKRSKFASVSVQTDGYPRVTISRGSRKTYECATVVIHRLLALHFIPNPDDLPCVDHRDTVRTNNALHNLRWVTVRGNNQNQSLSKRNTSGVKGVTESTLPCNHKKPWCAGIVINKKLKRKYFATKAEACAWRAAMEKLHYIQ